MQLKDVVHIVTITKHVLIKTRVKEELRKEIKFFFIEIHSFVHHIYIVTTNTKTTNV